MIELRGNLFIEQCQSFFDRNAPDLFAGQQQKIKHRFETAGEIEFIKARENDFIPAGAFDRLTLAGQKQLMLEQIADRRFRQAAYRVSPCG